MIKYTGLVKVFRSQLLTMVLYFSSVAYALAVQTNQKINPEKPQEALFKIIFNPLAELVGEAWALVLLILIGSIIVYLVPVYKF